MNRYMYVILMNVMFYLKYFRVNTLHPEKILAHCLAGQ